MKIELVINKQKTKVEVSFYDNTLTLSFDSLTSYQEFLKSPKLPVLFFMSEKEKKQIKKVEKYLKKNTNDFLSYILSLPINIIINDDTLLDFPNNSIQTMLFDIRITDYQKRRSVLNVLPANNALYKDLFNESEFLSKEKMLLTYQKIDEMINTIKDLNLSPAENASIIFDLTRARTYKKTLDNSNSSVSRDLSHVMFEKEIVCAGFVNIFACLASALNIPFEKIYWHHSSNKNHVSLILYINDNKYDIHGLYAFEPTFASKKDEFDVNYINDIRFSFMPLAYELKDKEKRGYTLITDTSSFLLTCLYRSINRMDSLTNLNAPEYIIKNEYELTIKIIKSICDLVGLDSQFDDDVTIDFFIEYISLIFATKTAENLIRNVRNIENKINPELYPNDEESINKTIKSSVSYKCSKRFEILVRKIFDDKK